jgi:hypothetical protein
MPRIITYECTQCGTEVVVTENMETELRPIYCCGIEITEVSSVGQKSGSTVKKTAKKTAKKPVKKTAAKAPKKTAGKEVSKKPAAKKKPVKK